MRGMFRCLFFKVGRERLCVIDNGFGLRIGVTLVSIKELFKGFFFKYGSAFPRVCLFIKYGSGMFRFLVFGDKRCGFIKRVFVVKFNVFGEKVFRLNSLFKELLFGG